jgi:energy-coupling factor transporter ATP-binding protein EcfA2
MKAASVAFAKRLQQRLHDCPGGLQALRELFGVSAATAERFRLGLSEPYPKVTEASPVPQYKDVLVAPTRGKEGNFLKRYVYRVLPGITIDNRLHGDQEAWSTGPAATYYSRKPGADDLLMVVGSVVDLWALVDMMSGTALERSLTVIASTHGTARDWPHEWATEAFWSGWKAVYIAIPVERSQGTDGDGNSDGRAHDLARLTRREVHRLAPVKADEWHQACTSGLRADSMRMLLRNAAKIDPQRLKESECARYETARAVDLSSAYHKGHLYEAVRVLKREDAAEGSVERYTVVVVRSDRMLHEVQEAPYPPGTPRSERVLRLVPDGTQLARKPAASPYGTWRWASVQAYVDHAAQSPPLADLIDRLSGHLRASVWLPRGEDYCLLACTAVVTFCQQIFDAVPLILLTGPAGSGKTTLAGAMSDVCANSPGTVGLSSGATLSRLADMARGFVSLDDLEKAPSELLQALKVSYKKESAQRFWTNADAGMRVESLNFYGVKMINNTTGVDDILETRMLSIPTRAKPQSASLPRDRRLNQEQRAELRDQLHIWAFTHVRELEQAYAAILPDPTTRSDEIAAPLQVVARLSGSAALQQELHKALNRSARSKSINAHELLDEAIQLILLKYIKEDRQLRRTLTVQEVLMRLRLLEHPNFGKTRTTDISDVESPEWVGRQLRHSFAEPSAIPQRFQMHGVWTRAWPLDSQVVERAIATSGVDRASLVEQRDPKTFCKTCRSCDYDSACEMKSQKMKREATSSMRELPTHTQTAKRPAQGSGVH